MAALEDANAYLRDEKKALVDEVNDQEKELKRLRPTICNLAELVGAQYVNAMTGSGDDPEIGF